MITHAAVLTRMRRGGGCRGLAALAVSLIFVLAVGERAGLADGCTKDIDCKGDRVCIDGRCVDPPVPGQTATVPEVSSARPTPLPESTPAMPAPRTLQKVAWIATQHGAVRVTVGGGIRSDLRTGKQVTGVLEKFDSAVASLKTDSGMRSIAEADIREVIAVVISASPTATPSSVSVAAISSTASVNPAAGGPRFLPFYGGGISVGSRNWTTYGGGSFGALGVHGGVECGARFAGGFALLAPGNIGSGFVGHALNVTATHLNLGFGAGWESREFLAGVQTVGTIDFFSRADSIAVGDVTPLRN